MTTQQETDRLRAELCKYLTKVPPSVNNGSHNMTVAFKKHLAEAKKTAGNQRSTPTQLASALNSMRLYWTQPSQPASASAGS